MVNRARPVLGLVLALFVVVSLSACAQRVAWEHPTIPEDFWATDLGTCRDRATRLVERELSYQDPFKAAERTGLEQELAVFDARKRILKLTEECMRDKGYRPVRKGKTAT